MKGALAPSLDDKVTKQCQTQPYGLMCDGSSDRAENKTFALLVRVFDEDECEVKSRFLDMPVSNIGTAEKLFECVKVSLSKRGIPWENLLAYNSDNASVMKGRHNSVLSRIKEVQPSIFDLGCICHLANLSVGVGMKHIPLPVEDLLIDIYFHFEKSCKRKEIFKEFQDFTGIEFQKIIKHCSTRWLSLLNCILRIIHQWPALYSYFTSHEDVERAGRVKTCAKHLGSHEMKLYYYFLSMVLKPLAQFNTTFQGEGVLLHVLHRNCTYNQENACLFRSNSFNCTPK